MAAQRVVSGWKLQRLFWCCCLLIGGGCSSLPSERDMTPELKSQHVDVRKDVFISWPFSSPIQSIQMTPDGTIVVWYGGREIVEFELGTKEVVARVTVSELCADPELVSTTGVESVWLCGGAALQRAFIASDDGQLEWQFDSDDLGSENLGFLWDGDVSFSGGHRQVLLATSSGLHAVPISGGASIELFAGVVKSIKVDPAGESFLFIHETPGSRRLGRRYADGNSEFLTLEGTPNQILAVNWPFIGAVVVKDASTIWCYDRDGERISSTELPETAIGGVAEVVRSGDTTRLVCLFPRKSALGESHLIVFDQQLNSLHSELVSGGTGLLAIDNESRGPLVLVGHGRSNQIVSYEFLSGPTVE